jgi:organic hydroperoxide reductase OsmC/OhrA
MGNAMSTHTAVVEWQSNGSRFTDNRYSRAHQWRFDGGAVVPASSSPHVVRVPLSDPARVDPEEAYVAALSSCHMLWFLSLAAAAGVAVDSYRDEALGIMGKNDAGKEWVERVVLRPQVVVRSGAEIDEAAIEALHHRAHEECYIANSVKTVVVVEGTVERAE